jgi:hypothetical protein
VFVLAAVAVAQDQKPAAPDKGTRISADLGSCSAEFRVTDLAGNPIYNAKIKTQIRYGFLSKRKLDLEVATDAEGKARFVKLPDELKKAPLTFVVTSGQDRVELSYDPAVDCHATYDVPLGKKPPADK